MNQKIKNIITFSAIALALILVYVFFIKGNGEEGNLTSSADPLGSSASTSAPDQNSSISREFFNVFLNVKRIKLDDAIFSEPSFLSLRDSSIELIPDGTEGRPNPFAPIGSDIAPTPVN